MTKRIITLHVLWATVCVGLVCLVSGLFATTTQLKLQNKLLAAQLAAKQVDTCTARDTWTAGTTRSFEIESDRSLRRYLVHLPLNFRADTSYPLVIYFSGKGASAKQGLNSGVSELPVIGVYPQATTGLDGSYAWQGAPYSSNSNDIAFIGRMLDQINGQLCIKRGHVYAVGMSNGGGFVALLSCKMPDRIAAFGMVAGAYYPNAACTPKKPAPVITIHGDDDLIVPYFGSPVRHLPNIDRWSSQRASQNQCAKRPFVSHQQALTVTTWQHCKDSATVRSVRIHGQGHVWSLSELQLAWRFFTAH